ncbi:hypothetical protein FB567DRAFT_543897 [Paraphoma chrysanthemicola]|uniref:Secreted protein n=1 Tax=Paraphoma chrysanthemicola TaxID=798071 RepID=A0A8K0W571_9PLEO|nr:hypothetical protein FB567DRAFT_543897 [Paraphoma chrysanthemicola]
MTVGVMLSVALHLASFDASTLLTKYVHAMRQSTWIASVCGSTFPMAQADWEASIAVSRNSHCARRARASERVAVGPAEHGHRIALSLACLGNPSSQICVTMAEAVSGVNYVWFCFQIALLSNDFDVKPPNLQVRLGRGAD